MTQIMRIILGGGWKLLPWFLMVLGATIVAIIIVDFFHTI